MAFVNRYVEKWVHKQLKLHEAEELFSDAEQDIDSLVEEYRQALLIRKFDQHLIEERIDTLVTADQIAAYHREHASDFKVNQTLVKGRIVRFDANNRQAPKLRKLMTQPGSSRQQEFADICTKNNFVLNDFSSSWVTFSEFLGYLPTLRNQSYDALLSSRAVQEMSDGHSRYYFEIKRRASSGRSRTAGAQRGDRAPHPLQPAAERDHSGLRRGGLPKSGRGGRVKIHEEEK